MAALAAALAVAALLSHKALRARWHLSKARAALEERDAASAIAQLEAAEELDPARGEVQFLLARAYRRLGDFARVEKHLLEALERGYSRERIQREQWLTQAQAGQLSQVQQHLGRLLTDPQDDGAAICEAYVEGYFATYRFAAAQAILDAWQADFPNDPQPHVYRGAYFEHLGSWAEAAAAYRKALERAPNRSDVSGRLARALLELHEYKEASGHVRRALEENPLDCDLLNVAAQCALDVGEAEEAARYFEQVLKLRPGDIDARVGLARIEHLADRPREAVRWLEPVCREQPENLEARYLLAQALIALGQPENAKPHFQFVSEGRKALLEAQKLTDLLLEQPDDYEARHRLGDILLKYDDPSHGAAWLRSVLEYQPDHAPTHRLLADYYGRIGNEPTAARHRELAASAGQSQ